ncbi:hypothetical protein QFZ57_004355 [Arthrobacter sp. B1I2]|nr:hypothetical protein [Arthrobacter sp. B1I2]
MSSVRRERARGLNAYGSSPNDDIRIYRCPERGCNGGFHLTSVPEGTEERKSNPLVMPEASAITYTRPLTCHLIDIENEMGGGYWTAGDVELWWQIYRQQAVGITLGDLVIVGVAERAARKVRNGMRGENVKWRIGSDGPDGADLALLNAVNVSRISRRYSRLVVASGDHIFAPLAQEARVLGMSVQVVLGKGRVSRDLKEAATIQTRIRSSSREAQRRTLAAIRTVHAAAVAA